MATAEENNTDLARAEILWKAADALRGQVDAAEYKHVVLGLLFLKYISDSFEARREELKTELEADGIEDKQLEPLLENRDEYTAERVFWVPPEARWTNLQNQAARADIATLIDDAILAVERDNPNLKGKLPRDYARRGIAPEKMKGLIDLIADIGFGRATVVAYTIPPVSLLYGYLLLDEPITPATVGGILLILAGVSLIARGPGVAAER